ncbi:flagellar motor switch protein FliG [Candidatus Kuenenia stuttgartiensis]|jgi:flagellar motor switch protein FliG|uniref:Flagellar motor switch protein FliG n=2 Tax=Kuenenia stuttgartiensis TaxID=174633 RepID=Q1Q6S0_KUEST|nr:MULTISPECIES: flagellar motor switch protein FliG [Kuenenia]MBE7548923.1 flagellar motor switch protein FliG [Planctomycetia bacterium]MBZ0192435.1 flagellar motor switch protein FliG [Candidatus Kuenenia stuttgartiensis]MCF6153021.1 flagellar motor switch protein FliG [Candidatus Kuenenia stuttgartiensis]MCL4727959.1 flagellar motor switch protein FliG [Candidatus Kuenenia stuttgartiensis]MCZ7622441.1 flagellar motor switch protein FliG [Candidatus Kuenenia sp.]
MKTKLNLSGIQKAAIALSILDPDVASEILKTFDENQIVAVSAEITRMENVDNEIVDAVLDELRQEMKLCGGLVEHDKNAFRKILEKAIGTDKSDDIIANVEQGVMLPTPFSNLKDVSDDEYMRLLIGEHPQTIALILSYTEPERASRLLSRFPLEAQSDIIMRIATLELPPISLITKVNEVVMAKIKTEGRRRKTPAKKRHKFASEIIGGLEGGVDKDVIEQISRRNPELAEEIKKLMFTFDDMIYVLDEAFRKILTEVDINVIALALKTANAEVETKFFKNMSKRIGETVREERELLGPRLLSEVQSAQLQIVEAVKRLEAKGENVVQKKGGSSGKDDKLV